MVSAVSSKTAETPTRPLAVEAMSAILRCSAALSAVGLVDGVAAGDGAPVPGLRMAPGREQPSRKQIRYAESIVRNSKSAGVH